ncbi:MAG: heme lyase CcmF/NrfE family subunit, partial [Fidelibacterota bacterium]
MAEIGYFALILGLIVTIYSIFALTYGALKKRDEMLKSGENGVIINFFLVLISTIAMVFLLFSRDFSIEYVASYTNSTLSMFYTLTALWAGQKGSLLFWLF